MLKNLVQGQKPYSAFEHLWRSLVFEDAQIRLFAMLTVYLDESGTDGRSPIVLVGGYVSTVERWENFAKEWKQMKTLAGIESYHATDLDTGKDWGRSDMEVLAAKLIHKYTLFGVLDYVEIAPCEKMHPIFNSETKEGRRPFSTEYSLAATRVISSILKWAHGEGYSEPINFVFESGGPGKGMVLDTALEMKKMPSILERHLIGGVSFDSKPNVIQLESADRLVYHGCHVIQDWLANRVSEDVLFNWMVGAKVRWLGALDEADFPSVINRGWEEHLAREKFKQSKRDKAAKRKDESEN